MTDGLEPIKHVYGEAPESAAPSAGTSEFVELEALRGMKEVLDGKPHTGLDRSTVQAVKTAAASEALRPLRHALGEEGALFDADDSRRVELEILQSTLAALATVPRLRPDDKVVEAVKAAFAAQVLGPVRAVYDEAEAPAPNEPAYTEYALMTGARAALEKLPALRPDPEVLAALRSSAKLRIAQTPPASDRPPASRSVIWRWTPALAMAASLVVVAITGLWVAGAFQNGGVTATEELVADAGPSPSAAPGFSERHSATPQEDAEAAPTGIFEAPGGAGQPTVARERLESIIAAAPPRAAAAQAAGRPERARDEPADDLAEARAAEAYAARPAPSGIDGRTDTNMPATAVSEWDAGEDVRVLSLRLNQMANSNEGLAWDRPPTPLGASDADVSSFTDGVQAVRSGAPAARVDVQMSSRTHGNRP